MTRFGRVTLYGADMLALGAWVGPELGAYAAGRRVTFAFVALGLVIPAMLGPAIARAWAEGTGRARNLVATALEGVLALAVPAALGLALTAERWTPHLFGAAYHDAGPWLALVCARLPFLLAASFAQAVLVACRRERWALGHVLGMLGLAAVTIPIGLAAGGPWGVGWAVLAFEAVGAAVGWGMLARLGVAPTGATAFARIAAGCLGLVAACRLTGRAPLAFCCAAAAMSYGIVWRLVASFRSTRSMR
jgi:O-antigen/teichoic acid export membrane protein